MNRHGWDSGGWNNYFVVSDPFPDRETALALARFWFLIPIDQTKLTVHELCTNRTLSVRWG